MNRRWTILVVPHDTQSPRQFSLGERGFRAIMIAGVAATLVVATAVVLLFSPWATPGARLAARENARLKKELARVDAVVLTIGDSLNVLAQRETQFRELTGIPSNTSEAPQGPTDVAAATPVPVNQAGVADRPRPFAAFFGARAPRPDVDALLRQATDLSARFAVVSDSMEDKLERLRNTPSIMPTQGWFSGAFSRARLHPILHEMRPHEGIDVSAPMGSPIVAPAGGTVTKVAVEGGYGNVLEIDHGNGIVTRYAHCSRIVARPGQRVERGQMVATVGNTGLAVGPHLHYEIHVGGKPVNPLTYVLPEGGP